MTTATQEKTNAAPSPAPASPARTLSTQTAAPKAERVSLPKYQSPDRFLNELRRRVDAYFETTGLPRRDCPAMYRKSIAILGWMLASYVLLVFFASSLWMAIPLAISLGVALAAIGFNIQHDGGHSAYSDKPWLNRLAAASLDVLGASSYVWRQQHTVVHHSFANIDGHDSDIDLGGIGRLAPTQKRYWFHRFQHFYLWPLYGFVAPKWQFIDDFRDLIKGRICGYRFPRPRGKELALLIGGKLTFISWALVLPMCLHGFWVGLGFYFFVSMLQGAIMATVIQLAHAVEEAEFPVPNHDNRLENSWAVHQVQTTVDYARNSRLVSWFTGGLNFQIEHHLFARICHIHYPAISKIVEATCHEYGLPYYEHPTFWAGMKSHYRWLRAMGQPVSQESTQDDSDRQDQDSDDQDRGREVCHNERSGHGSAAAVSDRPAMALRC